MAKYKGTGVVTLFDAQNNKENLSKHYYNLSDHQVEYQILDRQSFKECVSLQNQIQAKVKAMPCLC